MLRRDCEMKKSKKKKLWFRYFCKNILKCLLMFNYWISIVELILYILVVSLVY